MVVVIIVRKPIAVSGDVLRVRVIPEKCVGLLEVGGSGVWCPVEGSWVALSGTLWWVYVWKERKERKRTEQEIDSKKVCVCVNKKKRKKGWEG